jgi:hypothetical protein
MEFLFLDEYRAECQHSTAGNSGKQQIDEIDSGCLHAVEEVDFEMVQ